MSHFAGSFCLARPSAGEKPSLSPFLKLLGSQGGRISTFQDGRLALVHSDSQAFTESGFLRMGEAGPVAALAGELILNLRGNESFSRTEDLRQWIASLDTGPPGILPSSNGTFALCAYDPEAGRLVLAADPLGAYPLYYCLVGELLIFSTAFSVLLDCLAIPRELNLDALAEQYAFCYPLDRRTLLRDVWVLRDAEYLVMDDEPPRRSRYFDWTQVPVVQQSRRSHLDACFHAFQGALRSRSHRPGPHVVLLSGGLDSRVVVGGLQDLGQEVVAVNCANPGVQDHEYAARFAQAAGVQLAQLSWSPEILQFTAGKTTSGLLHYALRRHPGRFAFSADGGGETLGFHMMTPEVMHLLDHGRREDAIQAYTAHRSIPSSLLHKSVAEYVVARPAEAMRSIFTEWKEVPGQKAMQLFLLLNDLRRHLHDFFEDVAGARPELLLPFYDRRVLEAVVQIAPPLDSYLRHSLYYEWLELFRAPVRSVPWQAHPSHLPCPLPDPAPPATQWAMVKAASDQMAGRWRRSAIKAALTPGFPRRLLRRGTVIVAAFVSLFASRFNYIFTACLHVLDACRIGGQSPQTHSRNWRNSRSWQVLRYYMDRIGLRVRKRRLLFFEKDLDNLPLAAAPNATVRIAALSLEDLQAVDYPWGPLRRARAFAQLAGRDCRILGAFQGAQMLATCAVELDDAALDFFDLHAHLGEQTGYVSQVSVVPAARNRGIASALMAAALNEVRVAGRRRAVFCCVPENQPMIRIAEKMGWRMFHNAFYFHLIWYRRYRFTAVNGNGSLVTNRPELAARQIMHFSANPDLISVEADHCNASRRR